MRVWRLFRKELAAHALTGWGAREYGGRWNSKGVALVYCASSLSLAVLETLVHLDDYGLIRTRFASLWIDVPDELARVLHPSELPSDWADPGCSSLKQMGDFWVRGNDSVTLVVPSAIVPQEMNILLNPNHPDFPLLTPGPIEDFQFDARLG